STKPEAVIARRECEQPFQGRGRTLAPRDRGPGTMAMLPVTPLLQPGREEALDLATAARPLEAGPHDLVLDDDERRHRLHAEALHEVGTLFLVDAIEPERAVVAAALKNLGEEPFDAPAGAGDGRIEEHQARLLRAGDSGGDDAPPSRGTSPRHVGLRS